MPAPTNATDPPSPPAPALRWFHRHPVWTLAAVTLCAASALVLLAEGAARWFVPAWAPVREERTFWRYDPLLGWAHRPHERGRFNHPDFSVEVTINGQGLRGRDFSTARTAKKRLLVIGDSYAWGYGVETRDRFSELLEARHPDWEILNAGVCGYGTDQAFLWLREHGLLLKPDAVLLVFCDNDFENNVRDREYGYSKPRFVRDGAGLRLENVPVPKRTVRQRLQTFLLARTYLGPKLYHAKAALTALLRRTTHTKDPHSSPWVQQWPAMADITGRILRAIHDLCRQQAIPFVLVSAALSPELRPPVRDIADQAGIPYLPLDDALASAKVPVTWPHDEHWNVAGHRVVAEAIDAFCWRHGAFDPPHPPTASR